MGTGAGVGSKFQALWALAAAPFVAGCGGPNEQDALPASERAESRFLTAPSGELSPAVRDVGAGTKLRALPIDIEASGTASFADAVRLERQPGFHVPPDYVPSHLPPGMELPPGATTRLPARRLRGVPSTTGEELFAPNPSPAPAVDFQATAGASGPPDTMGAVGPEFLVVMINGQVRIQTRDGTTVSSASLFAFWSAGLTGVTRVFDPEIQFDPMTNRFIASTEDVSGTDSDILVAVSQTDDPNGAWNFYRLDPDAADSRSADFPALGFNATWVAITVRMFGPSDAVTAIFICDKASLVAGTASCTLTSTPFPFPIGDITPAITLDPSEPTLYLGRIGNGTVDPTHGQVTLSTITGPVGAEVVSIDAITALIPATWNKFPGVINFLPQQGSTTGLEPDGFTQGSWLNNLIVRNGSIWGAHTIFLPVTTPTHATIQWWQLSPTGTVEQSGQIDDSTAVLSFAYPSVGVNGAGDMLIGYSRFSANQFVGANYSYRAATDPSNTLRDDREYKAGEATFLAGGSPRNRWGDYSNTMVDPNDRHLWTIQEYAETSGWGLWWARVGNDAPEARCRDFPTTASATCQASITTADIDDGSFDPDGDSFDCVLSSTGPFGLGPHTVTLTCTDSAGDSDSCTATVTVTDASPPVITPPPNVTTSTCTGQQLVTVGTATAVDNCAMPPTIVGQVISTNGVPLSPPIPVVGGQVTLGIGTHVIVWVASDGPNTAQTTQTVSIGTSIQASQSFLVEDRAQVQSAGGGFGAVLNSGPGATRIGNDSRSGTVLSVGPISVLHRAVVNGDARSASTVFREPDGIITGTTAQFASVVLPALPGLPAFPPPTLGSFTVNSGTQTRPPGSYLSGTVNGGTLVLAAGDYFFRDFTINSAVTVRATPTTRIFVQNSLIFRSPIRTSVGLAIQPIVLGFAGTNLVLEAVFNGTLVAPNALVSFGVGSGLTFTGSFFGRTLQVRPASRLVCQAGPALTGSPAPPPPASLAANVAVTTDWVENRTVPDSDWLTTSVGAVGTSAPMLQSRRW